MNKKDYLIKQELTQFRGKTFSSNEQAMKYFKEALERIYEEGVLTGELVKKESDKFNKYHSKQ